MSYKLTIFSVDSFAVLFEDPTPFATPADAWKAFRASSPNTDVVFARVEPR